MSLFFRFCVVSGLILEYVVLNFCSQLEYRV